MEHIITIRPLTPDDLQELRSLSIETFNESFADANTAEDMKLYNDEAFSLVQLLKELNNPESFFYFALIDSAVVGYLKLNIGKAQGDLKEENGLELARIYVRKEFQGKKIGQILLDKTIEIARKKKANFVWLGVWERNYGATRFYERNGFKKFSTHHFMLGKDQQTDNLLKLMLDS